MEYIEVVSDLENRIRAHKLFSKTSLEKVLEACLESVRDNAKILDLGCGSGNFYDLFASKAQCYIGIDISDELLREFSNNRQQKAILICSNMDDLPRFQKNSFDAIFSIYSIYYSLYPKELIQKLYLSLSESGEFFVVGPSKNAHAAEINEFCNTLTQGRNPVGEKNARLTNFHSEIVPGIFRRFSTAKVEDIDGSLYFPSPAEWARYASSTPQVRECCDLSTDQLLALASRFSAVNSCLSVSKHMTVVTARK